MGNSYNNIDVVIKDGIYWLTLNRPAVRTALHANMLTEIDQAFT